MPMFRSGPIQTGFLDQKVKQSVIGGRYRLAQRRLRFGV